MVDLPNTDVTPEPFTQSVDPDVVETPPAERESAEVAANVVEDAPPVTPDWIYEEVPEQYPQDPPMQLPAQPPVYPQQPPPTYQPPPMDNTEAALNAFVKDPLGFVRSIQQEGIQQVGGQLSYQQQQLAQQINHIRQTTAAGQINGAKANIQKAYDHLNSNPTFRSNKAIQEKVKSTLQGYLNQASEAARYGDYGPIGEFSRIGPEQLDGMMAYYGVVHGLRSPGVGPLQVEGATVESSRPSAAGEGVVLTPLQEDIARRMGPGYREKMIKAQAEEQKYNDFEVKG